MTLHPLSSTDSPLRQALTTHRTERDEWLARVHLQLQQDQRVDAAWLFGSLGRGDADELSDIDLFVIVNEADFDSVVAQRPGFVAQIARPLLILEAPQNWPPGGVYAMALYPGTHGPHQVDWYWVRRSWAQIPTQTQLLFDRVSLPRLDQPTHFDYAPVPERSALEVASQTVNRFWAMLSITAKYVARAPWEAQVDMFNYVLDDLRNSATFAAVPLSLPMQEPPHSSPAARIQCLHDLAAAMEFLMPHVAAKGAGVPKQIAADVRRFLRLVEAITLDADSTID